MRYLILGGLIKHLMFECFMRYLIQVGLIKYLKEFCEVFDLSWSDKISHSLKFYDILIFNLV